MVRWSRLVLVITIGILAAQPNQKAVAFTIVPAIHQKITVEALSESSFNYVLPNGLPVAFQTQAARDIAFGNRKIDIWSLTDEDHAENYHFDDGRFRVGQKILINTRDLIIGQLMDPAFRSTDFDDLVRQDKLTWSTRELMGNALHTLQDYYSHSTWVETNNLGINPKVGVKPEGLEGHSEDGFCSDDDPAIFPLTSGDYLASGVTDCASICNARPNRCAHGNVLTTFEWSVKCAFIPLNTDCGINKDRGFRTNHAEAFSLAKQHTSLFVAEIFNEALKDSGANESFVALAICQFMGVPNPLSTCVTSHTVTVQKLNNADGSATLEGLVQSSGNNITPAIDCGPLCEGTAIAGTSVVLTATSVGNWRFVRWGEGGACAGSTSPACSFTVTANQLARPEFIFFDFVVVPLSPRASFLRSDPGDLTLNPIVITLNELGIVAGQVIELSSSGFFSWGPPLPEDARSTNAVFSSTSELLPHTELHRVPGAIAVSVSGQITTNTCSSPNPLPTNIAEDFFINNPVVVTVPTGAHFLLVGTFDCAYGDNSDSNGDLAFTIRYLPD